MHVVDTPVTKSLLPRSSTATTRHFDDRRRAIPLIEQRAEAKTRRPYLVTSRYLTITDSMTLKSFALPADNTEDKLNAAKENSHKCPLAQVVTAQSSGGGRASMLFDLGSIQVQRLIAHELPRHFVGRGDGQLPSLSEVESPLNQTVRNFFREKLSAALAKRSFAVEFDPVSVSPLPDWISGLLGTPDSDFVSTSQLMAKHLHQSQTGVNPEGLLTVIALRVEGSLGVAILKLEKEEGTRVQRTTVSGRSTLSVGHIRDLMLTGKTRVFKVGLFARAGGGAGSVAGLVCDRQGTYEGTPAYFFLERFLGCRLQDQPELTTRRFFEATEDFINQLADPERQGRYQVALVAELSSPRSDVSPLVFATTYLEPNDHGNFIAHMHQVGLSQAAFEKNNDLIKNHLQRIQWTFQSGVAVLAPPKALGQEVEVETLTDGRTRLEIIDLLKRIKGQR